MIMLAFQKREEEPRVDSFCIAVSSFDVVKVIWFWSIIVHSLHISLIYQVGHFLTVCVCIEE